MITGEIVWYQGVRMLAKRSLIQLLGGAPHLTVIMQIIQSNDSSIRIQLCCR